MQLVRVHLAVLLVDERQVYARNELDIRSHIGVVIATGDLGKYKVPRGSQEPVILPVTFSYAALNATDITWNNMYAACGHLWPGTVRPGMSLASYLLVPLPLLLVPFRCCYEA